MAATVFFSWQADTPNGIGRNFVRRALEDACADIVGDGAVDEARRGLEVDSDTQGVAGQPPIVETILKKIDAAKVFVADMTFVAKRLDGGASPNPNVLIEYGWALKSLTHQRIICVMNTSFGRTVRRGFTIRFATCSLAVLLRAGRKRDARKSRRAKEGFDRATHQGHSCLPQLACAFRAKARSID